MTRTILMIAIPLIVVLALILLLTAAPSEEDAAVKVSPMSMRAAFPGGAEEDPNAVNYADAVGTFGVHIFKILGGTAGENVFLSPLSIEFALNMIVNGAGGETREVMKKTLGLANVSDADINAAVRALLEADADSKIKIDIANSLWHDKGVTLLDAFIKKNAAFAAEIRGLDFGADESVRVINEWIGGKTRGMIPTMLDRIAKDIVLFAVNAIYFNGEWAKAFDSKLNQEKPFTSDDGAKKNVTFMSHQGGEYRYHSAEDVSVVELAYGKGRYSMYIFLPKQGMKLVDFLSKLTWAGCKELLAAMRRQPGNVSIPIFKTSYGTVDLIPALNRLGMGLAFSDRADLTGISNLKNLAIGQVLHKAVIEVNEKGTEAAAATVVGIRMTSALIGDPFSFTADRPFAYIIMDNASGTPVFMGKLEKP